MVVLPVTETSSCAVKPGQTVTSAPALARILLTVTAVVAKLAQPLGPCPSTVYVAEPAGITVTGLIGPILTHAKVVPSGPVALSMTESPGHITGSEMEADIEGNGRTEKVTEVSAEQLPLDTVTEYVTLPATSGVTEITAVVSAVLHKYVLPPLAVSCAVCPTQRLLDEDEIEGVGGGETFTVTLAVPVQPAVLVAVTPYIVCVVGETFIIWLVWLVLHKKVFPVAGTVFAVSAVTSPVQILKMPEIVAVTELT